MTAPLLTSYFDSSATGAFLGCHSSPLSTKAASKTFHKTPTYLSNDRDSANHPVQSHDLNSLLSSLMELLPQGVIVVSRSLKPVYWNQKAKHLCRLLANSNFSETTLPFIVAEISQRFIRDASAPSHSLILEHQTISGQTLRLSARWLELPGSSANPTRFANPVLDDSSRLIAVFLENCDEVMNKEVQIQQEKYDLTDREAEIWMLIRQEYSYLEIAQRLQISLNTVKTHVKNVYAKRRSHQETEKFWCHGA